MTLLSSKHRAHRCLGYPRHVGSALSPRTRGVAVSAQGDQVTLAQRTLAASSTASAHRTRPTPPPRSPAHDPARDVSGDGPEPPEGPAAEFAEGLGRAVVRREQDNQLLGVRGEFECLAEQVGLVPGRVVEAERPTSWNHVPVQAAGEVGAGDAGEFRGEPLGVPRGRTEPQVEGLLVGDVVPVGEELPCAGVGEDVARQIRCLGVEQAGSSRQLLVAAGVGEDVGKRVHHRHRRIAVTALFYTGPVFDADAARAARSERRRPGDRRRPRSGSPHDWGWILSRLVRMKSPNGEPMPRA